MFEETAASVPSKEAFGISAEYRPLFCPQFSLDSLCRLVAISDQKTNTVMMTLIPNEGRRMSKESAYRVMFCYRLISMINRKHALTFKRIFWTILVVTLIAFLINRVCEAQSYHDKRKNPKKISNTLSRVIIWHFFSFFQDAQNLIG